MKQRYFLEVMYQGTAFHGSQLQGNLPTVQLSLNQALSTLLREPIETFGASRTDEGVHALCNYYHFDYEPVLNNHLHYKLNSILPPSVTVTHIYRCVGEPINARFDAMSRAYRYRIYSRKNPFYHQRALYFPFKIERELLQQSAEIILKRTHFESFSKRKTQSKTFTCQVSAARWEQVEDQLHFVVVANRFLRGMVRGLVGTQLQVGRGKLSLPAFEEIFDANDCTRADFSVPGFGLYLEKIEYPSGSLEKLDLM